MELTTRIIIVSWVAFFGYWTVSAIRVKKDIVSHHFGNAWFGSFGGAILRTVIVLVAIFFIVSAPSFGSQTVGQASILQVVGAILCAGGIAFAIWARWHLGRNWSPYPALKEGHELVTSGPYRFVRHPIYTGILAAVLGSTLTIGWPWIIMFVLIGIIFVRRIFIEEKIMMTQFPDAYPPYRKRTKALIPFVW